VYAVEFSHRSGRDLLNVAKKRTNIIPIIEDARHPHKYRMLVGMCLIFISYSPLISAILQSLAFCEMTLILLALLHYCILSIFSCE